MNAPTKADVKTQSRKVAQAQQAAQIAAYREAHAIAAHVSDRVVAALMVIEQVGKSGR